MEGEGLRLSRRALVIVVVAALLVGMAVKTLLVRDSSSSGRAAVAPPAGGARPAGPTRLDASGLPVGFAHSRVGALAAAVSFVTQGERLLRLAPDAASAFLGAMAARETGAGFVEQQQANFDALRNAVARGSGPTLLRAAVAATRVDAYTARRARVRIWRVLVLSREGMTTPGEQWATVTYELVWQDGDWRVWSEDDAVGPSPSATADPPASPSRLETTLVGFDPYPTPARGG
jgi:hypothetical protein